MKHIKIFEEFQASPEEENIEVPFSENEIRLLKLKTRYHSFNDKYIIVGLNSVQKLEDNIYLIDGKVKCTSINDLIKYSNEQYNKFDSWFTKLFKKCKKEVQRNIFPEDKFTTYINTFWSYKGTFYFSAHEEETIQSDGSIIKKSEFKPSTYFRDEFTKKFGYSKNNVIEAAYVNYICLKFPQYEKISLYF